METKNDGVFIDSAKTAEALINIQFKHECPQGNATKVTSLILQTLAFFLAIKRNGTNELIVGSSSEGRKILMSAYGDLAAAQPLHPETRGYISSFRHPDELSYTLNITKSSPSALSSNFLTNIERNPENYGDFKYEKETSTLRIPSNLQNFEDALSKLEKAALRNLTVFALRSIPLRTTNQNGEILVKITRDVLAEFFGVAGELLWNLSGISDPIDIRTFSESPANIVPPHNPGKNSDDFSSKLISALAAKPFVILAGGTGTGKTRAARQVARQIAGKDNVRTVAVGADWTDNRPLLGFRNLLSADGASYVTPEALQLILAADRDLRGEETGSSPAGETARPFFLILDEMNLSHVERYFADFLSSMESGEALKLHDHDAGLKADGIKNADGTDLIVPPKVEWPRNLFVIGTVNIDETTYMFSPKVLDRAHVIEFRVDWDDIKNGLTAPPQDELVRWDEAQARNFISIALDEKKALADADKEVLVGILQGVHACVIGSRYNFAHRTARECLNYVAAAQRLSEARLADQHDVRGLCDFAILQKALPKLNGSTGTLTEVLDKLIKFTDDNHLPNCAAKLKAMAKQLKNDQFVSFIQ